MREFLIGAAVGLALCVGSSLLLLAVIIWRECRQPLEPAEADAEADAEAVDLGALEVIVWRECRQPLQQEEDQNHD